MKLFIKAGLFFLLLLISLVGYSQQQIDESFTLEECIEYALKNSMSLQNARIDETIAKARVGETRGIGLPNITGNVQLVHNTKLPRMFLPGQTLRGFLPPEQQGNLTGLSDTDIVGVENLFQLGSSGDAGISINQLIFNGSYIVGLQAAKTYKELSNRAVELTEEQIKENVTKAYFTVLINKEQIGLFNNNIARVDTLLRNTTGLYENGFAEKIDVDRVKVTYNNLVTERNNFENLQSLGKELLKFQMNYPMNTDIEIEGTIEEVDIDIAALNLDAIQVDYSERAQYNVLQTQKNLYNLDVKNNYASSLPVLSAFGNFGYSTQSPTIRGLFRTETDFEMQGIGPDKWYPYGMIGLNLSIPLFTGLQNSYKLQQAKLTLKKAENDIKSFESTIDLQVKQAKIDMKNSLQSLESQKENMELAAEIARVTSLKYSEGVGSNLEVIEAETALREAQINYYNALYNVLNARVNLLTALGTID